MQHIYNILRGMVIGIANVIPGVSGGTMAVIFGIYEKLTSSLGNLLIDRKNFLKNATFLALIGIGAVIGILAFARGFTFLLANDISAQATYVFFIGLIAGSFPLVKNLHEDMKPNSWRISLMFLAVFLVLMTSVFATEKGQAMDLEVQSEIFGMLKITEIDPAYAMWLIICGFLGAGSMVLPGFSGSALLISIGEYSNILYFVDQRMIIQVICVLAGAIPGIFIFAKIISYLIKKFPSGTYYFILGLLAASIIQILIMLSGSFVFDLPGVFSSLMTLVAGTYLSFYMGKIKK